jgi:hemoglobin-like flavoprotein
MTITAPISAADIGRVRSSFALIESGAAEVATQFYGQLFQIDPGLRALFTGDMSAQGQRLMQMLGAAVALLERPGQLLPVLRQLGSRHAGYGVREAHYASVGTALIMTLEQRLGAAFTAETRAAWLKVYGLVSAEMRAGAEALLHDMVPGL